jgi:DNA-binding IclR family transcriptional regulator
MKPSRTMTDVLSLAEAERSVVNYILRQRRSTLSQISQQLEIPTTDLQPLLNRLVSEGFLTEAAETASETAIYQIAVRTRPHRPSAEKLWDALSE